MASLSKEIILTSSADSPITAYDPITGTTLAHFSGSRSPRQGLALVRNNLLATSHVSPTETSSGFIRLYNWWSSTAFHSIPVPEPVGPIAVTPDGSYIFAGGLSGNIHTLSLPSGDFLHSFPAHRQPISCLVINEDSSLLISGGDDGMITVFPILGLLDASSIEDDLDQLALYQFAAHGSSITGIAFELGGGNSTIVTSSLDSTCKFWSMAGGTHLRTIRFRCTMWCVTVDPTNSMAYAGGSDGRVHVIPMRTSGRRAGGEMVAWQAEQSGAVTALTLANDNKNLVSASEDGMVRIWEVESGSVVMVLGHEMSGSISDLLVTKAIGGGRISDKIFGYSEGRSTGFCEREILRKVREMGEMEEWLNVAVKDRRRAIDMLEATIETYGRLLGILLKEAKGGDGQNEARIETLPYNA